MAQGLIEQREQPDYQGLGFEERLGLLVDREVAERENRRLQRYLKSAKLRAAATVEDIDFRRRRGLDKSQVLSLAEGHWVTANHAVVIVGPTGVGKTYLACALAHSAIRHGHTALYLRVPAHVRRARHRPGRRAAARLMASWGPGGRSSWSTYPDLAIIPTSVASPRELPATADFVDRLRT